MSAPLFTEALESRVLMSGNSLSASVNVTIELDRLQIRQDLLKFKSDSISCYTTLQADVLNLRGDHLKDAKTVTPLIAKFRADIKAMRTQLRVDRLTERQNVLADESVIVGELKQIVLDKGNATAEAADHATLMADRIKLQNDAIAGLDARLSTRQGALVTLTADMQNILTAAQSDPNASPKLVNDLTKLSVDRSACLNSMSADLQTLITDRTKLVVDLTALQSA